LESEKPPAFYQLGTLEKLCHALACKNKLLAQYWETRTGGPSRLPDDDDEGRESGGDALQDPSAIPGGPRLGKLSTRARIERQQGVHALKLSTKAGDFDLLGCDKFKRVFSMPDKYDGSILAVQGTIDEYIGISRAQRQVLGIESGQKFCI